MYVRWVTALGALTASTLKRSSSSWSPSHRRSPRPRTMGTIAMCMWSIRSAARNWRIVDGPPPIRTSRPPAASRAASRASAGLASMKRNVVPPFISIVGLGWWVRMNTGGMEGRVVAPPALPLLVGPRAALGPELVASHDLGPDARAPVAGEGVVHSRAPSRLALHVAEAARGEEPLMEPGTGVSEGCFETLALAGAEPGGPN